MKRTQFSIGVLLLVVAGIAVSLAIYRHLNPPPIYPLPAYRWEPSSGYALDSWYENEITEGAMAHAPTWDRRNPDPPLSANDAMVRADRFRRRLIKEKKLLDNVGDGRWELASAQLTPYDESSGQWYWHVQFVYAMSQTGPPNELYLVVLMDGTVIEPSVTKQENIEF